MGRPQSATFYLRTLSQASVASIPDVLQKPFGRNLIAQVPVFRQLVDSTQQGQELCALDVAGEVSSINRHLCLEAGNITECFVAGKIAGENVAQEKPWS